LLPFDRIDGLVDVAARHEPSRVELLVRDKRTTRIVPAAA
jgi:hypothetical protein